MLKDISSALVYLVACVMLVLFFIAIYFGLQYIKESVAYFLQPGLKV